MLPIIDVSELVGDNDQAGARNTPTLLRHACSSDGFFYVENHGVPRELQQDLESQAREFFRQSVDTKRQIAMAKAGTAWRGYFGLGDELTSGVPDLKEGIYFGEEHPLDHPRVKAGIPLHGPNLFPAIEGFKRTILEYMAQLQRLGHALLRGIALSLALPSDHFRKHITFEPTQLFRIFHYPPTSAGNDPQGQHAKTWGVGEHTDYGLLTILRQDQVGGLQVKSQGSWIEAPPIENTFVCNIGDMLDRMTRGLYRSTPHRVKNTSHSSRLSFPYFFDPSWDAKIQPITHLSQTADAKPVVARSASGASQSTAEAAKSASPGTPDSTRWDGENLQDFDGTYGDYICRKVAKVFPQL